MLNRLIIGLAEFSRCHALAVALAGLVLALFAGFYAVTHLSVSTDTDLMFSSSLPWRQQADAMNKAFPQFNNLLVAVVDAREPEEADATAAALADAIAKDHSHFETVRRPDASPFLRKEGLLFLDTKQLSDLMNRTIDAQPFLGQLASDPTARGLFQALSLLGIGVSKGDEDITPYLPSLEAFHQALADALAGHPKPLSWQSLLGGNELSDLAGKYHFVLVQPKLDYGALEPGGEATRAMRN
ncbi:MAG TPA: RND transporter, partial [Acetobacteraceae bacterium]